jgi:hypothetical protein
VDIYIYIYVCVCVCVCVCVQGSTKGDRMPSEPIRNREGSSPIRVTKRDQRMKSGRGPKKV